MFENIYTPRSFIGFDTMTKTRENLFKLIEQQRQYVYPPYNIRKTSENSYVIELAAAGYSISDFEITIEDDALNIKCEPPVMTQAERDSIIHCGLTNKNWARTFILGEYVRVKTSSYVNGMLRIFLEQQLPEEKKPIRINIEEPSEKTHPQLLNENSDF
jgi:molecular chaperone IbpA